MPRTSRTNTLSQIHGLILKSAARHPERRLIQPETVKASTYRSALQILCRRGLITEGLATERSDISGSLVLTYDALALLGLNVLAPDKEAAVTEIAGPRPGSKQALCVMMLKRIDGASVQELTATTGWLPHTTRAALTGLRKRGLTIRTMRASAAATRYYLADEPVIDQDGNRVVSSDAPAPVKAVTALGVAR